MERRICRECGKEFVLTEGEIAFYERKGFRLPKRCKACRQKRKTGEVAAAVSVPNSVASDRRRNARVPVWVALCLLLGTVLLCALFIAAGSRLDTDYNDVVHAEVTPYVTAEPPAVTSYMVVETPAAVVFEESETPVSAYVFRSRELREEHFQKHGADMGFATAADYEAAASAVVTDPDALHRIEAEDGDDVYYKASTNEFVIVSTDGYIRTYFFPEDGMAYFERQ